MDVVPRSSSVQALAIVGDRIAAIGSNRNIKKLAGPKTKTIDLQEATVLPGFIDCHTHLIEYGLSLRNLDLRDSRSIQELKQDVSSRTEEAAPWVLGRGWDQEKFVEKRYPTRHDLDEACPERPVFLRRVCGHIGVANSAALRQSGITAATPNPNGGIIDRDASGEPTGILRENAMELVEHNIPEPRLEDYEIAVTAASEKAVEAGLTSVHCIVGSSKELRALLNLKAEGRLLLRFYIFVTPEQMQAANHLGLRTGFGDQWVRFAGVKIFTDGSLGARTAALRTPYSDDPHNCGVAVHTQEELDRVVLEAHRDYLQVAVHAIGDRAIAMALESVAKAKNAIRERNLRHRIEHAIVLNPQLIERMKKLELIASVQPRFVVSDFWIEKRLGTERSRFANPYASLLRAGVMTVAGSDCPIEPLAPLQGIEAAANRLGTSEAISVEDAIALYTRAAAYASSEENVKGTITPDKYADLVVLGTDPSTVPPGTVKKIEVHMTLVGGRIVFRSISPSHKEKEAAQ